MPFAKTKIVCTIGPESESRDMLARLARGGMDIARLNLSHGNHASHSRIVRRIRSIAKDTDQPIAVIEDLQGPRIRVGACDSAIVLRKGQLISLAPGRARCTQDRISVNYPHLRDDARKGNTILIDDGLIELRVEKKRKGDLLCRVISGGDVLSHKGVNLPDIRLRMPALTTKDRKDARFGISLGVDYIALSFVKQAADVIALKNLVRREKADIPVIAKIERPEALADLDNIIDVADAVMVARGDLGVVMPPEDVPGIQKEIIWRCNRAGVPVITATQMLESMRYSPRPTRAEASDVANAVIDGTDAVMLSAETSVGKHPYAAVRMMDRIVAKAEAAVEVSGFDQNSRDTNTPELARAVGSAAVELALRLNAACIVCFTRSGFTADSVARHRPPLPVVALTASDRIRRRLSLRWGVDSLKAPKALNIEEMTKIASRMLPLRGLARKGDYVVITAGMPIRKRGTTNTVRAFRLGDE